MSDQPPGPGDTPTDNGALMARSTPQSHALDFQYVDAGPGVGSLRVPFRDDLVGDPATGGLADGVVTTLIDHTCGNAIGKAIQLNGGDTSMGVMATLDLRVDYMRPAKPGRDVTVEARCYKVSQHIAFVRAVAFEDEASDPVATGQAAFMLSGAAVVA
jgi:acyl-coenzyme A thioesterase PaaI-like protein